AHVSLPIHHHPLQALTALLPLLTPRRLATQLAHNPPAPQLVLTLPVSLLSPRLRPPPHSTPTPIMVTISLSLPAMAGLATTTPSMHSAPLIRMDAAW